MDNKGWLLLFGLGAVALYGYSKRKQTVEEKKQTYDSYPVAYAPPVGAPINGPPITTENFPEVAVAGGVVPRDTPLGSTGDGSAPVVAPPEGTVRVYPMNELYGRSEGYVLLG